MCQINLDFSEKGYLAMLYARTFGLLDALLWDLLEGSE